MKRFEEFVSEASGARKPKAKEVTQAEFDRIAKETAEELQPIYRRHGFEMTMDDCMQDVLMRMRQRYKIVKESAVHEGYGLGSATKEEALAAIKQHKLEPTSWANGVAAPSGDGFAAKRARFFRISDEEPPRVIAYVDDPKGPSGGRSGWVEYTT